MISCILWNVNSFEILKTDPAKQMDESRTRTQKEGVKMFENEWGTQIKLKGELGMLHVQTLYWESKSCDEKQKDWPVFCIDKPAVSSQRLSSERDWCLLFSHPWKCSTIGAHFTFEAVFPPHSVALIWLEQRHFVPKRRAAGGYKQTLLKANLQGTSMACKPTHRDCQEVPNHNRGEWTKNGCIMCTAMFNLLNNASEENELVWRI